MKTDFCVVYVTCPERSSAERIATALVEGRLAACANIVTGVTSVFHWEGRVDTDPEVLLIIKTRSDLLGALEDRVTTLHDYDVPEIIALPIIGGSRKYLDWIDESLQPLQ
jgi:periplasmic divalent cation tolerance protein